MTVFSSGASLGAFEILDTLGEGGMGVVYRARDTRLQREVALKFLLPAVAGDPDRLARFAREAQVLASLNHPNIAGIHGLEEAAGVTALVLELVEGPTLADRLASGPIPLDESLGIARQIAEALDAAHEQGIVHRDLKPANIKLRPDGTVKVLDFGLAKAMEPPAGAAGADAAVTRLPTIPMAVTTLGMIVGTAAYMSPEQASGRSTDRRTDIWAFGVVLGEMVTGRRMFEGETVSHVLAAVLTKQPDLSAVPPRVRHLVERCLEKDPKKRLRDIGDAMSLVAYEDGTPPVDARGRRLATVAAWLAACTLAVTIGVVLWRAPDNPTEASKPPVVRLQIPRASVDPYNNAASALAVSPDGRFLAHYVTGANGRATLAVQTLATGERREVPGSAVLSPLAPFWSPDNRQIAYGALQAASVFDVVTGTTRELCACRFRGGSWNSDGVILLGSAPAQRQPIRRLTLEERTPVPVTTTDAASVDTWPVFLPDGQRFIFTRTRQGSDMATYLGTLGGGAPIRIAAGSRSLFAVLPRPLGPYLLGIDAGGLVAQALEADTLTAVGEPVLVEAGAAAASISTNGVLVTSAPASTLVSLPTWFDRTGRRVDTFGAPGSFQGVALAPDGRTVALTEAQQAAREGGTALWLRDVTGPARRLNVGGGDSPVWSPDGVRLLVSFARAGVVSVFERSADGTGQERESIVAEGNTFANDWSRDGRWVIYTLPKGGLAGDTDLDLWVIPADGGSARTPVPYLTGPARDAQAAFSPDARFVAYTSTDTGDPQVYVQPFPNATGGKWLVSTSGGSEPRWSADGKELFYFAGQTLMVVPVSLQPTFSIGSAARLFEAPVQPWYVNDTDRWQVSADGRRFLLLVSEGETAAPPIDVVVNWSSLLRR
jgi:eukaryotic-like serine/threonine-protein kinase